ncbi:MAG: urease accessory protein UreD [Rhodocyclaceae bacterium]|nr:MAG: urease accessory protein UreD [Rhodocyclaceae bacterium]
MNAPLPTCAAAAVPASSPWEARLELGFSRRDAATVLTRREHSGPLRVQKALYPEGPETCHVIVLHPPSGIAGGDRLAINAHLASGSKALLTTPGAGKWYRSIGDEARQDIRFHLEAASRLEWLPQETIVFDAARAGMDTHVALQGDARYLGWEVLCLGLRASGESFAQGSLHMQTRINRDGIPLWLERGRLSGGDPLLASPVGLAGKSVCATLLAAAPGMDAALLAACRDMPLEESDALSGITLLPDLLVARYLGHSSEAARHWLTRVWGVLRPALLGREAQTPRIWNT